MCCCEEVCFVCLFLFLLLDVLENRRRERGGGERGGE